MITEIDYSHVEHDRKDLHSYQADIAIPFMRANPYSFLMIDLGLGKTVCSLTVILDLLMEFEADKILIIGPKRVATQTWMNEKREWRHLAHMNPTLIHVFDDDPRVKAARSAAYTMAKAAGHLPAECSRQAGLAATRHMELLRQALTHEKTCVHIISVDWVEWLVMHWQGKWPYRVVFIDESSMFKDHTTNRFKALAKVRNTPGLIERMHLLTATPAAETYMSLFAQAFLLDGGKAYGKKITPFRDEFFTQNAYTKKWALRPNGEEAILKKIAHMSLVMRAKDYLDIEEPVIQKKAVVLTPAQMEIYHKLEQDFIVELPSGIKVEAETAAALSQKLLQTASGTLYETYLDEDIETQEMSKVKRIHHIHDEKLDALEELIEEAQSPVLVTYWWKASLDKLKKRFPKATVMDADGKCVNDWNKGKIPVLLMHPKSGGHGLNLQKGPGHTMVIYDLFHSLELFKQVVGRLARQGQKRLVYVFMLCAVGTLDDAAFQSIKDKDETQEKMFKVLAYLIKLYRKLKLAESEDAL